MRQNICDGELRISRFFTDADLDDRAVALHDNAVHGERNRRPLVLFDAAVVVRFEVRHLGGFIKRDGL